MAIKTVGNPLAEGKTKIIWATDDPHLIIVESKNDITAGDGAKHDIISGKAALATKTTSNVFRYLKNFGIPVAFEEQIDETHFTAPRCEMIPYEVVVRREAHGSYLKRRPDLEKGHVLENLLVEFFLKTTGKIWNGHPIPKDDPLIFFFNDRVHLFLPDQELSRQKPFMVLGDYPCKARPDLIHEMGEIAKRTFFLLELAWRRMGGRLVDFKVEFGIDHAGKLLLADVIDNDSWRVIRDGSYIDKQLYRDGGDLNEVTATYTVVAGLTDQF